MELEDLSSEPSALTSTPKVTWGALWTNPQGSAFAFNLALQSRPVKLKRPKPTSDLHIVKSNMCFLVLFLPWGVFEVGHHLPPKSFSQLPCDEIDVLGFSVRSSSSVCPPRVCGAQDLMPTSLLSFQAI